MSAPPSAMPGFLSEIAAGNVGSMARVGAELFALVSTVYWANRQAKQVTEMMNTMKTEYDAEIRALKTQLEEQGRAFVAMRNIILEVREDIRYAASDWTRAPERPPGVDATLSRPERPELTRGERINTIQQSYSNGFSREIERDTEVNAPLDENSHTLPQDGSHYSETIIDTDDPRPMTRPSRPTVPESGRSRRETAPPQRGTSLGTSSSVSGRSPAQSAPIPPTSRISGPGSGRPPVGHQPSRDNEIRISAPIAPRSRPVEHPSGTTTLRADHRTNGAPPHQNQVRPPPAGPNKNGTTPHQNRGEITTDTTDEEMDVDALDDILKEEIAAITSLRDIPPGASGNYGVVNRKKSGRPVEGV